MSIGLILAFVATPTTSVVIPVVAAEVVILTMLLSIHDAIAGDANDIANPHIVTNAIIARTSFFCIFSPPLAFPFSLCNRDFAS